MEYKNCVPVIEAEGTSYEIGYTIGTKAKPQVHCCIQSYKDQFEAFVGLEWSKAKKLAQQYKGIIEEYNHDYIEEMQGIADGAGVEFDDILLLNCRSEVVLRDSADSIPDGCTSIAVTPKQTKSGGTLIGQNWDWKLSQRDAVIIVKIKQTTNDKPNIVLITEAGIIGKFGMNSAGLGFCFNALAVNDFPHGALPLHIACRGAIESQNLCEAITKVTQMQLGCAVNFLFASRDGVAVDVEVSNDDFDVLYPENGIMIHTNHFRSLRLPRYPYKDTSKGKWPDTYIRLGRALELTSSVSDGLTVQDLQRVFADHADYPTSICHHEDPRDAVHARLGTVMSFIMDLYRFEIHVCLGAPCEKRYELYKF